MALQIGPSQPYLLLVNSLKRADLTTPSTKLILPLQFPAFNIRQVRLLTAAIPNTIIVFNGPNSQGIRVNNQFSFIDSIGPKLYQIPEGTYTFDQLKTLMEADLALISPDTYTLTLDTTTYKMTISSSSASFQILFSNNDSPWYEFGFTQQDTIATTDQTSTRTIRLDSPPNIYIRFTQFTNTIHDTDSYNYAFCIPVMAEFGAINYFNQGSNFESVLYSNPNNPISISSLAIELYSEFGPINLGGSDWSCLLQFT